MRGSDEEFVKDFSSETSKEDTTWSLDIDKRKMVLGVTVCENIE
jgi:hypothetical protein